MTKDVLRDHLAHGVGELQPSPVVLGGQGFGGQTESSSRNDSISADAFLLALGLDEAEICTIKVLAASHAETVQDFIGRLVRVYLDNLAEKGGYVAPGSRSETAVDTA